MSMKTAGRPGVSPLQVALEQKYLHYRVRWHQTGDRSHATMAWAAQAALEEKAFVVDIYSLESRAIVLAGKTDGREVFTHGSS